MLNKILSGNSGTEFGKRYDFSDVHGIEEYKKKVPLSAYSDYEQYIIKMRAGENNILVSEDVKFNGISSGTTESKNIFLSQKALFLQYLK